MRIKIRKSTFLSITSLWSFIDGLHFGIFRLFGAVWSFNDSSIFIEMFILNFKIVLDHDRGKG